MQYNIHSFNKTLDALFTWRKMMNLNSRGPQVWTPERVLVTWLTRLSASSLAPDLLHSGAFYATADIPRPRHDCNWYYLIDYTSHSRAEDTNELWFHWAATLPAVMYIKTLTIQGFKSCKSLARVSFYARGSIRFNTCRSWPDADWAVLTEAQCRSWP